jgi:hypothetical protein
VNDANFNKLNVDENPSLVEQYHIQAIATLMGFGGGKEKKRVLAAVSGSEIARALETYGKTN